MLETLKLMGRTMSVPMRGMIVTGRMMGKNLHFQMWADELAEAKRKEEELARAAAKAAEIAKSNHIHIDLPKMNPSKLPPQPEPFYVQFDKKKWRRR